MSGISAENINPFLIATVRTLEEICGCKFSIGKLFTEVPAEKTFYVSFSVMGNMEGEVFWTFDKGASDFACRKLLSRYHCDYDESLFESTICELCNIIIGNAASLLENNGIQIKVSTPVYLDEIKNEEGFKIIKIGIPSECGNISVGFKIQM